MKRIKYLFSLAAVFVLLLVLCSCSCIPSEFDWGICGITDDVTFANGQTIRTYITSNVYEHQPFGVSSDDTYIKFFGDGSVEFKPIDSEVLCGTYTLKHNGFRDTNFTVTFDNGEKIEDGYAVAYIYGNDMYFTFRGIRYAFNDGRDTRTREALDAMTDWLIKDVRNVGNYLYRGVVTLDENGGKLSSEKLDEEWDLFAEGRKVIAVHISSDNELTLLDELRDGECVFTSTAANYVDGVKIAGLVIYYVDPLPEDEELPPEYPIEYGILDIVPELEYYLENPENALLKMSKEHSPSAPGEFNEHLYVDNGEDVALWLSNLKEATLVEMDSLPYGIDEPHLEWTVELEDKLGENTRVVISYECGAIYRNDKWYSCSSFADWYSGKAVYTFSCQNYSMKALNGGVEYYNIYGIEFRRDSKQDYEYPEDHYVRTLSGEVGEIAVYDATHFYYNGYYYVVTSEKDFAGAYH